MNKITLMLRFLKGNRLTYLGALLAVMGNVVLATAAVGTGGPGRNELDDDRFRRRTVASHGSRIQRDQRIGLRVIRGGAASRGVVFDDAEVRGTALDIVVVPFGDEIDVLAVPISECSDVVAVDEHDASAAFDSSITIAQAVDRGVELIVTAERLE